MSKRYHENYLRRVDMIQRLTKQFYQPESIQHCYAEVWRRHIYPLYAYSYDVYMRMLKIDVEAERNHMKEAVDKPDNLVYQERTLFDFIDASK